MAEDKNGKDYARALDEYKEAGTNWRIYLDARFKQLTVFLTATGALLAAVHVVAEKNERVYIAILGMFVAAAFLVLEERTTFYRRAYMRRARELERTLGFLQYTETVIGGPFTTRFALRVLFWGAITGWAFLMAERTFGAAIAIGGASLFALFHSIMENFHGVNDRRSVSPDASPPAASSKDSGARQ